MKSTILLFALITISLLNETFAQGDTRQIRKEVHMEMLNDEITLTITTTDEDKITSEVFIGVEAELKLAELEKVDEEKIVSSQEIREEFKIEDVNGISKLTIRRIENGNETEAVFFGPDADKKINELENRENAPIKIEMEEEAEHSDN